MIAIRAVRKIIYTLMPIWYRLKIALLWIVVGEEAIAYVLYNALFPKMVLQIGGATIGNNVRVGRWLTVHRSRGNFRNLSIGDDTYIGKFALIDLTCKVTIGKRVGIGMFAKIFTHQNLGDTILSQQYPYLEGDIIIPDDAVISTEAILLYPTTLPEAGLVSALTVMRGEYDTPGVYIGNPARTSFKLEPKQPQEAK